MSDPVAAIREAKPKPCGTTTKKGTPCTWPGIFSGRCFTHDTTPEGVARRQAARRRGGGRHFAVEPLRLGSPRQIITFTQRYIAKVMEQTPHGDPHMTQGVAALLRVLLAAQRDQREAAAVSAGVPAWSAQPARREAV